MWKRALRLSSSARALVSSQLAPSAARPAAAAAAHHELSEVLAAEWRAPSLLRLYATVPATGTPSGVSGDMAVEIDHATGLEREELLGEVEGKPRFELAPPQGPFGTVEAPAVIESYYDERLVGCSGGIGDEEHDVVWFQLKKDAGHECSVCGQVFQLKVVGPGGPPGGHH